jgi:hypothetical protein
MANGKGRPKSYFVVVVDGAYIKLAGIKGQPEQCPSYFNSEKSAMNVATRIIVGHPIIPCVQRVSEKWLLDLANNRTSVKMQIYVIKGILD